MGKVLRSLQRSHHGSVRLEQAEGRLEVVKEVDDGARLALEEEARALGELQVLPGPPRLIDFQRNYLRREYLPGRTLSSICFQQNPPQVQAQAWLVRLQALLRSIHERGFWPGDVSPANVLVGPDQKVSLLDWGAARWGTPLYRRPEDPKRTDPKLIGEAGASCRRPCPRSDHPGPRCARPDRQGA